ERKKDVDKALDVLITFSERTSFYAENVPFYRSVLSRMATYSRDLTPEEVDVITNSGNPMKPVSTLMAALHVDARTAKNILDNAMNNLSSKYQDEAAFYDTASRTADLIKNSSALALTVGATLITGGATLVGETALLTGTQATIALVTTADALIKTSKSAVELAVSQDINLEGSNIGTALGVTSAVSDLTAITSLHDPDSILDSFVFITGKSIDFLYDKKLTFGTSSMIASDDAHALYSSLLEDAIAYAAFPGTYHNGDGTTVTISYIQEGVKHLLELLDEENKIEAVKNITLSCPSNQKVQDDKCVDKVCKGDDYNCPLCKKDEVLAFNADGTGYCEVQTCEAPNCCAEFPQVCNSECIAQDAICQIPTDDNPDDDSNPTISEVSATINISGHSGSFYPVAEATVFAIENGYPGFVAMTTKENVDEEADILIIKFDKTLLAGETYTIKRPENGSRVLIGFNSPQITFEGDKIGFYSTSGSITIEEFGTNVGDRISGSFSCEVEDYTDGTGKTGQISGTFNGILQAAYSTQ
ncbi:MAG: hypothetical protein U9N49_01440, partial [Campylobacterota bacterium]|nr:hypothetical protein [Campylobacterota bacterium]